MMRASLTVCLLVSFVGLAVSGCGSGGTAASGSAGHGGSAGQSGKGGAAGKGGASGMGGGAAGTGGLSGAGGSVSGTGGMSGTGGGASGTGGASATGGASGGASGTSGTAGAGGASGTTGAGGAGGASGTTGAAGAGGASGTTGAGGAGGASGTTGAAGSGGGGNAGAGGTGGTGSSACGPCNTPPTSCHALTGTCVQGRCDYAFIDGADCDDGNACTILDTCTAGACKGTPMVCTTPRAPACLDATRLQTYDNPGVCSGGRCVYTQQTITCGTGGCSNNACQTDPCASVTCNTPPSVCYDAAGTCSQGSCSYPPNQASCNDGDACTDGDKCSGGVCSGVPKLCNSPDPDSCRDASTAIVHDRIGRCASGACSYTVHYVSCPAGCDAGACKPSGWTAMTSNSNQSLSAVWGTSSSSVWAVGGGGTALYFDGIQWQARPTPAEVQPDALLSLSGTSDSNIFASGIPTSGTNSGTSVIRFDGTSWSYITRLPIATVYRPSCVAAYGDNDAFVFGRASGSGSSDVSSLYRITNGVSTLVMSSISTPFIQNQNQCALRVFSPTDIVVTANSIVLRIDSVAKTATPIGNASSTMLTGALWGAATNDIFVTAGGNAQRWTGGPSWSNLTTGLNGLLLAVSGTSSSRVFAAGWAASGSTQLGTILYWDSVGWTVQTIPAATPRLQGIWAAPLPEGRVFAVGLNGTILTGP